MKVIHKWINTWTSTSVGAPGKASKSLKLSKTTQLLSAHSYLPPFACHSVFYFRLLSGRQLMLSYPSFDAEYPFSEHDFA